MISRRSEKSKSIGDLVVSLSRSGIAVFDALVSCKLMGRRPLYIGTGRGVTDPLTGPDFP
jgi:hypothetical protein